MSWGAQVGFPARPTGDSVQPIRLSDGYDVKDFT
jgi:hypothetical protein